MALPWLNPTEELQALEEKLSAFDPSTAADVDAFQPHLRGAEQAIAQYDDAIGRASAVLQALTEERTQLYHSYAVAVWKSNLLSRLVPDVLREIFAFVRDGEDYSLVDRRSAILPLAHTCRQWRLVAMSQPSLWTTIRLTYNCYRMDPSSMVKLHLEKSGSRPLKVEVSCDNGPALITLLQHCWRWEECVSFGAEFPPEQSPYPALERLTLNQDEGVGYQFMNSPRLREFCGPLAGTTLSWHQLTTIAFVGGNERDDVLLMRVLSSCTNLECLRLDSLYFSNPSHAPVEGVECPRLRSLSIVFYDSAIVVAALRMLHVPAIESLELCITCEPSRAAWSRDCVDPFVEFLSRCRLTSLALKNIPLSDTELRRAFASSPMVERLVWWEYEEYMTSDLHTLAAALGYPQDEGDGDMTETTLPHLARLEISGGLSFENGPDASSHLLASLVGRVGEARLRHVVLEYLGEVGVCKLDLPTQQALRSQLESLVIREKVQKERGVFHYQDLSYDSDDKYHCYLACFDE
ncbi:hypothetical protein HDZ31DRAFT_75645 [Schizophyllum fasciatum]